MPYYLSKTPEKDAAFQQEGWTELGRYLRTTDTMHRLITIHAGGNGIGRDNVNDDSVLDFDLLQTGHSGYDSISNTVKIITSQVVREPAKPVIDGEVNYEGFLYGNFDEVQRLAFWACMLAGAAGHTYGANGVWQVNTREKPYGPSPHGNTWGNRPWDEAMRLPGSGQLGEHSIGIVKAIFGKVIDNLAQLFSCGRHSHPPNLIDIKSVANDR